MIEDAPAPLARSTALMSSGTAASRLLGFVRNALLVAAIGVNAAAADAFDVANKLPNALYALLAAGVLNAALVPQIVRAFQRPDGKRTVDRILTIGSVVSLTLTVILTAAASVLVALYTSGWPDHQRALAVAFALWCIPQLLFYSVYTLLGQVLNARRQFGPYMWAPVANNLVGITGLIAYLALFGRYAVQPGVDQLVTDPWTGERIALLAGVATLGIAVQALVLIRPLVRGGYRWAWVWRGPKGELSVVRTVAMWALGGVMVEQVAVLLTTRVASAANPLGADPSIAGNAAYFQGLMLYLVPHSLVTLSIVTALSTSIAAFAGREKMRAFRAELSRGLRVIGVFTCFAAGALAVLAPFVVRVALPTAAPEVNQSVSQVLAVMALGLIPLGSMVLLKGAFFALEDAKSLFFIHIPMAAAWVGVAYAVQWLTEPRWWVTGVAAGLVASSLVGAVGRAWVLRRKIGHIDATRVLRVHLKAAVAAIISAAALWAAVSRLTPAAELVGGGGWALAAVICAAGGLLMAAMYGIILRWWRVEELAQMVDPVRRKLGRHVP